MLLYFKLVLIQSVTCQPCPSMDLQQALLQALLGVQPAPGSPIRLQAVPASSLLPPSIAAAVAGQAVAGQLQQVLAPLLLNPSTTGKSFPPFILFSFPSFLLSSFPLLYPPPLLIPLSLPSPFRRNKQPVG